MATPNEYQSYASFTEPCDYYDPYRISKKQFEIKERVKHSQYLSSGVMKPIHKYNNGWGETICNLCGKRISKGFAKDLYHAECFETAKLMK